MPQTLELLRRNASKFLGFVVLRWRYVAAVIFTRVKYNAAPNTSSYSAKLSSSPKTLNTFVYTNSPGIYTHFTLDLLGRSYAKLAAYLMLPGLLHSNTSSTRVALFILNLAYFLCVLHLCLL